MVFNWKTVSILIKAHVQKTLILDRLYCKTGLLASMHAATPERYVVVSGI